MKSIDNSFDFAVSSHLDIMYWPLARHAHKLNYKFSNSSFSVFKEKF